MKRALTVETLLSAYSQGIFPMADSRNSDEIMWFAPDPRCIIPLDGFHISKTLARMIRKDVFAVTTDRDFEGVMRACAEPRKADGDTWISDVIVDAYTKLFDMGHAHSVECWKDGELVGGLYGVSIGGVFCGESMFHRETDASKVALAHLIARMKRRGFALLDVQFQTPHLKSLGAIEISREAYLQRLDEAIRLKVRW
jgi:leucyl/phenylalanyl-tRNA--protein transferase